MERKFRIAARAMATPVASYAAAKPEQVMSPSGPVMALASSTTQGSGGFLSEGPRPVAQDILRAISEEVSSAFMLNGHTGVVVSSAAGGVAEDTPQTTNQRLSSRLQAQDGGLQLEDLAPTVQVQLPGPGDVAAAQAEVRRQPPLIGRGHLRPHGIRCHSGRQTGEVVEKLLSQQVCGGLGELEIFSVLVQGKGSQGKCGRVHFRRLRWRDQRGDLDHKELMDRFFQLKRLGSYKWFRTGRHYCLVAPQDPKIVIRPQAALACQLKPYKQKCSGS